MTVSVQDPISWHTANGATTVFAYQFKILSSTQIAVYIDDVLTTSGFTVDGVGVSTGGNVTFTTAPANGSEVLFIREVPAERTDYDYQSSGDFISGTVNNDIDQHWMFSQQLLSFLENRALMFPKTLDRSGNTNALPVPVEGNVLYWSGGEIAQAPINTLSSLVTFESVIKNFPTLAAATSDANITADDAVDLKERTTGNGGGGMWGTISGTGTANGFDRVAHDTLSLTFVLRTSEGFNLRQIGADGTGATETSAAILQAISLGGKIDGVLGDTYLVNDELNLNVANSVINWNGAIVKADTDLPNTKNIIKITAANVTCMNGEVNGNKANLVATFAAGIYGNGVLVTDGGDGARVTNMTTHDCPTNGQLVVSAATAIDDVIFTGYKSYDNGFTGIGAESQVTGDPITRIYWDDGETYDNLIGGDVRIQGIEGYTISNHRGHPGTVGHGPIVIGVGEANNNCVGSVYDSFFESSTNALASFDVDALVGGAGPQAGLTSTLEVNLDNVRIKGAGGSNGLYTQNGAIVTGSNVTIENHTSNVRALTNSLVMIDNLTLNDAVGNAAVIDALVDLPNLRMQGWGSAVDALFFLGGASDSTIEGCNIGYPINATGSHDGGANASVLSDSTAAFIVNQFIGFYLRNTTDGSQGVITANTATTVTATLAGGSENDWDVSDVYEITKENGQDGLGVSGTPSNITLSIDSYTGTGNRVAGVSGAILNTWKLKDLGASNTVDIIDGIAAPAAEVGRAKIYVDIADGDLKVIFGDGTIKTIVVDS